MKIKSKQLRKSEEIFNSITHGVGILGGIAITAILVTFAALYGSVWHIVTYSIFGAALIAVYTASTLFHGAKKPRLKVKLNRFDHSMIYILIAGTYAPITLVSLNGALGWVVFGIIWAMAIGGVVYKVFFYSSKYTKLSTLLYLVMGWTIIPIVVPVIRNVPTISLWFLLAGCLTYSFSVIFYLKKEIPYGHGVFHILIMCASVCHFFSFLFMI